MARFAMVNNWPGPSGIDGVDLPDIVSFDGVSQARNFGFSVRDSEVLLATDEPTEDNYQACLRMDASRFFVVVSPYAGGNVNWYVVSVDWATWTLTVDGSGSLTYAVIEKRLFKLDATHVVLAGRTGTAAYINVLTVDLDTPGVTEGSSLNVAPNATRTLGIVQLADPYYFFTGYYYAGTYRYALRKVDSSDYSLSTTYGPSSLTSCDGPYHDITYDATNELVIVGYEAGGDYDCCAIECKSPYTSTTDGTPFEIDTSDMETDIRILFLYQDGTYSYGMSFGRASSTSTAVNVRTFRIDISALTGATSSQYADAGDGYPDEQWVHRLDFETAGIIMLNTSSDFRQFVYQIASTWSDAPTLEATNDILGTTDEFRGWSGVMLTDQLLFLVYGNVTDSESLFSIVTFT